MPEVPSKFRDLPKKAVNAALHLQEGESYDQWAPFKRRMLNEADGRAVASAVFSSTRDWFAQASAGALRPPSRENWRIANPQLASWDPLSPEVDLERRLVKARKAPDWWNQVPVASGLAGGRAAIDLVHDRGDGSFDFVELKVGDQHPVYAAVEILQYGFVWLLSRGELGYGDDFPLLKANEVRLCVLAPESFYRASGDDGRWAGFASGVNDGVAAVAKEYGVKMTFRFKQFKDSFMDDALRDLLDSRFD